MGGEISSSSRIMRRSIFTFLQNYHHFTAAPSLLLLPFAAATLLSHPIIASSSYLFPITHGRLTAVFVAAGFPPSSQLFSILNLKLSQTILSSLFVAPFTLSFLLAAKAALIKTLHHHHKPNNPFLFTRLFVTQICNSLVILSANATCLSLIVISFNISDAILLGRLSSHPTYVLLLSAIGAVLYSVVLANAYVVCNLSLILSGLDDLEEMKKNCTRGFNSILKACFMIKGRGGIALSLAVPVNMALAAVEALFQYRVVRAYYYGGGDVAAAVVLEAVLIAYLYGLLVVLDTIVGYVFLESCKLERRRCRMDIEETSEMCFGQVKGLELVL